MRQILAADGTLVDESPLEIADIRRLYRFMVSARMFDRKSTALQKQGRLATYAPYEGQEGAQIGSAAVLEADDWMVGTYRDAAAMWMQGYPWASLIAWRAGDERGCHPPADVPVLPASITVGAHMLHAVGLAWASKLKGDRRIAITYFGDGATSEGDFHEAMNFAAVYETPTVFFCQNNGYAISMPRHGQTRSETIAQKADAYGMPGVLVDGNDVLATYEVTRVAAERARGGDGPTLIEALTYRAGPHTTNDDPHRYRTAKEESSWEGRDPIERVRLYLEREAVWDADWQVEIEKVTAEELDEAIAEAESAERQHHREMFESVFAEPTVPLERQFDELDRLRGER